MLAVIAAASYTALMVSAVFQVMHPAKLEPFSVVSLVVGLAGSAFAAYRMHGLVGRWPRDG